MECIFEFIRLRECFHRLRADGRSKRIKKFAFTIVCVYNRLRVDRVLGAVKLQFFVHRAGLPHGITKSQLKFLQKIKPSSTFLEGFHPLFRNENDQRKNDFSPRIGQSFAQLTCLAKQRGILSAHVPWTELNNVCACATFGRWTQMILCSWAIVSKLNVVVLGQTGHFFDENN